MNKVIFAMAMSLLAFSAQTAAAKECRQAYSYGSNSAILTGRYIGVAKDNAIVTWAVRVTGSVGPAYADWALAKNKSFRCVKQNGRHKCTAKARPCSEN